MKARLYWLVDIALGFGAVLILLVLGRIAPAAVEKMEEGR